MEDASKVLKGNLRDQKRACHCRVSFHVNEIHDPTTEEVFLFTQDLAADLEDGLSFTGS